MEYVAPPLTAGPGEARRSSAEAALEVLTDSALETVVEMVLTVRDGAYEAHSAEGSVRFTRHLAGAGYAYDVIDTRDTRSKVISALQMLRTKTDTSPPKKHSNLPL